MHPFIQLDKWQLCSSEKLSCYGETISVTDYKADGWYTVSVPQTVVGGLVENGVYEDPYYGLNMKKIPGYKHGRKMHFSFYPMPDDSPFRKSWWYRTEFSLDTCKDAGEIWLWIRGINYSAHVWINGRRAAGADYVTGSYRTFELSITNFLEGKQKNCIALELIPPQTDDLCLTFVDWCPVPPDDSMGIWQPIGVYTTGPIAVRYPFVQSRVHLPAGDVATLSIDVELVNSTSEPATGFLCCETETFHIEKELTIPAYSIIPCTLPAHEFPELVLKNPQLWWPYQMGKPQMHSLRVEFLIDGRVSDAQDVSFGIRDIRSRINEHGARVFSINGKEILIRGAAWAPDLMYRQSRERDEADIAFVKNSNMNAIRFEGNLGSDYMMELCDREGILVMAGWSCCNHWENWKYWKPGDMIIARESLISQLKRLRNHPSLMVWLYGSDFPPPEQVERVYLSVLREIAPQVSYLSNASAKPSVLQGKTGVKMSGPYNYVPPVYWYTDAMPGVAENFNTETGPEVCVPVIGSIRKFIPGDDFTQTGASWNHHAGLAMFPDTSIVNKAIERRFGKPGDLKEHAACAQVLGYECWRAMYEAYGRNFPRGTGVIGWMLNSSWPSVFWQLYDYYLEPTGAFFGSKKACEPLHIQYSYDDKSIWVVHTRFDTMREVSAEIKLFTNDSLCIFEKRLSLTIKPYDRVPIHTIAGNKAESPVYFLFLSLKHEGEIVSRNCYWLSSTEDVFIEKRKLRTKFYWPVEKHADFTALRALAGATIEYTGSFTVHDNENRIRVTIVNTSAALAFFLKARIYDKNTKEYSAPVFWDDNCVTLQPNERIVLSGTFKKSINIEQMAVVVEGWNAGDSFIK